MNTKLIATALISVIIGSAGMYLALPFLHKQGIVEQSSLPLTGSSAQRALAATLEKLLLDNVIWSHAYIVAVLGSNADAPVALERLVQGQEHLNLLLAPLYGHEAGLKTTSLTKEYVQGLEHVMQAAKAQDSTKFQQATKQWHATLDELTTHLSSKNPAWSREKLTDLFQELLRLYGVQIEARLRSNWKEDATSFEQALIQAHIIAQELARGIIAHKKIG